MSSLTDVLDGLAAAVEAARDIDLTTMTPAGRAELFAALEAHTARFAAAQAALLASVDRDGLHHCDGIRTARAYARHHARLSHAEAASRMSLARALAALDEVRAALEIGDIGQCQARRFARTWANPRVRGLLAGAQAPLLAIAASEPYPWFDRAMTEWERRADRDGTLGRDTPRRAALHRLLDGSWALEGRFPPGAGAILDQILSHYVAAELATDWATARDQHGDGATEAHLPRTAAERRADAVLAIFLDAVSTPPGGRDPKLVVNLLMSWDEYQAELARLHGDEPAGAQADAHADAHARAHADAAAETHDDPLDQRAGADDRGDADRDRGDGPTSAPRSAGAVPRAGTLDGTWIDPWDLATLSLGAHLRRVVVGADSTVIDLGRAARFFTGSARDAVMLTASRCVWAACDTPTGRCQADHLRDHARGGATAPHNGAPLCGYHNRLKNHRFRVWRDPAGTFHTLRPDGTEV